MNKIKYWRTERQFSQIELAQASGLPRYKLQQIELAIVMPSKVELEAISEALGVSINQLVNNKSEAKHAASQ